MSIKKWVFTPLEKVETRCSSDRKCGKNMRTLRVMAARSHVVKCAIVMTNSFMMTWRISILASFDFVGTSWKAHTTYQHTTCNRETIIHFNHSSFLLLMLTTIFPSPSLSLVTPTIKTLNFYDYFCDIVLCYAFGLEQDRFFIVNLHKYHAIDCFSILKSFFVVSARIITSRCRLWICGRWGHKKSF